MITLVTGYNNTGKTTWIAETIAVELDLDCNFLYEEVNYYSGDYLIKTRATNRPKMNELFAMFSGNLSIEDLSVKETAITLDTSNILQFNFGGLNGAFTELSKVLFLNQPENGLHSSLHLKVIEEVIKLHNQGYSIYIETHSDHIVNALCVAVHQGKLSNADLRVVFFNEQKEMIEIPVSEKGRIRNRPKGFFDEIGKALRILI